MHRWLMLCGCVGWCWVGMALADEAPSVGDVASELSFYRDIRPILQAKCQGCHQPAKAEGGYVMTHFARLLAGGESGSAAVVPGKPDESYLVDEITPGDDGAAEMPKEGEPLTAEQLAKIRQWIAAGAVDDTPASVARQFDADHPPVYEGLPVITAVAFSPDGTLLAMSGYHEVLLWKADGSERLARLVGQSERIEAVEFSPDGRWLAVAGGLPARMGEVQIWNVAERTLHLALPVTFDTIYGVSWSADSKRLAFGCASDNTVRVIEAESGKQLLSIGAHDDWVLDTVFSQDASHVVSVSRDRSMKLIEVATGQLIDNITSLPPGAHKGGIEAVDRHPANDQLLIGGADGIPKLYQMHRTKERKLGEDSNKIRDYEAMPGQVYDVAFSLDGSQFAAGSSLNGSGELRTYNTESGATLHKVSLPQGGVFAVRYSPDGKTIVAAGFDGMVRLFSAETLQPMKEFAPVEATRKLATQ